MTTTYKELRWSLKFDFRCFDDVPSSNILKQSKSRMILYCVVSLLIQDPRQYLQRVSWMVAPPWVSFLPSSLWSATLLNQPTDGDDYSQPLLSHCALTPAMGVSRYFRWYDQRFWRHLHRADENLGRMTSSSLGTSEGFRLQNPWLGSLDWLNAKISINNLNTAIMIRVNHNNDLQPYQSISMIAMDPLFWSEFLRLKFQGINTRIDSLKAWRVLTEPNRRGQWFKMNRWTFWKPSTMDSAVSPHWFRWINTNYSIYWDIS